MMTNTTISEIQNEIKGADDSLVESDSEYDYIRRIDVENVKVTMVKHTNENEKLFKDGLIVVSKNET